MNCIICGSEMLAEHIGQFWTEYVCPVCHNIIDYCPIDEPDSPDEILIAYEGVMYDDTQDDVQSTECAVVNAMIDEGFMWVDEDGILRVTEQGVALINK